MTDFTRTKMHFALALIGTLFALHPILKEHSEQGFEYFGYKLTVVDLYMCAAGLLALTVYCFAVTLISEKPSSRMERLGNTTYVLAILIGPLYGALWLSTKLADRFGAEHLMVTAPATAVGLGVLWVILIWWLRRGLGAQDTKAKMAALATQEMDALDRAPTLFTEGHYDLAVIEAWKALEARLRRVLMMRGYTRGLDQANRMIDRATRLGLVKEPARKLLQEVRQQWNVAVGTEPLTKEAAESALSAARHILATIPVDDPQKPAGQVL